MTAILYDTLRLSRTLRDKGYFTPEQAETLAEALGEASQDNLATKADIESLRAATKADINSLKADIESLKAVTKAEIESLKAVTKADFDSLRGATTADIAAVKADLLKWMFGAIGFQTVVILGAVFALAHVVRP